MMSLTTDVSATVEWWALQQ